MSEPGLKINRRELMTIATAAGAATFLATKPAPAAVPDQTRFQIIDTNVSLFQWPFRRLPLDETKALVKKLRSLGITQAWAGSFEGVLHRDLAGVNQRLADECKQHDELVPMGSVNPQLPGWERDLKECFDKHNMPGIRLHPNYHGYTLDDPRFARLLELATQAGRLVQIAVALEDTRTQHPQLMVPDVDLSPLPDVLMKIPGAKVQILNYRPLPALLEKLAKTPGVYFDVARVESTDGVPKLVEAVPQGRVLFGSHAPFLIPETALIRTHEASLLNEKSLRELFSTNALAVLRKSA